MIKHVKEIPSEIIMLGETWKIKWDDNLLDKENCFGLTEPNSNVITLQTVNSKTPESKIIHAFIHELFHAMLFTINQEDLSYDDSFVDLISGLIQQVFNQLDNKPIKRKKKNV